MAGVRHDLTICLPVWVISVVACSCAIATAQAPAGGELPSSVSVQPQGLQPSQGPLLPQGPNAIPNGTPAPAPLRPGETRVLQVQFDGLHPPNTFHLPHLATRAGEVYDPLSVEEDVKKMMKTRKFVDVTPKTQPVPPSGVIVIFQVVERPLIRFIKTVGNQGALTETLISKSELKVGEGMDPYSIKEARDKIESWYREHGWDRAHVSILEGNKPGDRGAIFLVDEGRKQKIWWVNFVGNTIADGARLAVIIDSKPGPLWLFKGEVDRKKIDEDVDKLTAYYRGLGFLEAKIGRELEFNEKQDWLTLTFTINEGPRYKVNDVRFIGNQKIPSPALVKDLKLKGSDFFNQGAMTRDLTSVRDIYGSLGYVFADIQADLRYRDERAHVDLVYNVKEGARYRVGKVTINIQGESTHTNSRTIYNRLSLHPGDILNTRKLRDDERRLKASSLFAGDPTKAPKIVFSPLPGMEDADKAIAEKPDDKGRAGRGRSSSFRGQAPDGPDDMVLEMTISGDFTGMREMEAAPSEIAPPTAPAIGGGRN